MSRSLNIRAPSDAGFTLVELLVSLTLMTLILSMLPSAFHIGRRGWETSAALDRTSREAAGLDFLRRRLAETVPIFDRSESGRSNIAFSGTGRELSFVAPLTSGPEGGGLYRFTVGIMAVESSPEPALVLQMRPYRQREAEAAKSTRRRALLSDVEAIELRYFGSGRPGADPTWFSNWPRTDRTPALVEIVATSRARGEALQNLIRVELKTAAAF